MATIDFMVLFKHPRKQSQPQVQTSVRTNEMGFFPRDYFVHWRRVMTGYLVYSSLGPFFQFSRVCFLCMFSFAEESLWGNCQLAFYSLKLHLCWKKKQTNIYLFYHLVLDLTNIFLKWILINFSLPWCRDMHWKCWRTCCGKLSSLSCT